MSDRTCIASASSILRPVRESTVQRLMVQQTNSVDTSTSATALSNSLLLAATVQEQQHIIGNLQEIIGKLKGRVQELELAPPPQPCPQSQQLSTLQQANRLLEKRIAIVSRERDAFADRVSSLTHSVEDLRAEIVVLTRQLHELTYAEQQWQRERSLTRMVENKSREVEQTCHDLRNDLRTVSYERRRWRALAATIAGHLEHSLQHHIQAQMKKMRDEDEAAELSRRCRAPRPHTDETATRSSPPPASAASPPSLEAPEHTHQSCAAVDPMDVLAVWSRSAPNAAGDTVPKETLRSAKMPGLRLRADVRRSAASRFLVPL